MPEKKVIKKKLHTMKCPELLDISKNILAGLYKNSNYKPKEIKFHIEYLIKCL